MELTKRHDSVETYANTANKLDLIFRSTTPDKKNYKLRDKTVLVMDLRDSSNEKLDPSSVIEIAGRKSVNRFPSEIDEKSYRPYSMLEMYDQYDVNKQGMLKIDVSNGYIDFIEGHMLEVHLKSPDVVDWTKSEIEFEVIEEAYREPAGV
mgnify:CR=1 FL=1